MTDTCNELGRSLHCNLSSATLLLCVFHVLHQVWRQLYDRQHGVSKDDRLKFMILFRNLVYAHNVEGYEKAYENVFNSSKTQKQKNCVLYFEELFEISKWKAKYARTEKIIRGSNNNNYAETQFLDFNQVGNYMLKVNNGNTRTRCEIC